MASSENAWEMLKARSISDCSSLDEKPPDPSGGASSNRTDCGFIFQLEFRLSSVLPNLSDGQGPSKWTFKLGLSGKKTEKESWKNGDRGRKWLAPGCRGTTAS